MDQQAEQLRALQLDLTRGPLALGADKDKEKDEEQPLDQYLAQENTRSRRCVNEEAVKLVRAGEGCWRA